MDALSLLELNEYIQRVYALNFEDSIWVHFELSNVKESRGHIYFDCIEKDENSGEVVAHQSGAIWRRQHSFIKKKLGKLASDILADGIKVAAKVQVEFHPRYGSKLVVQDIDPAYTYGQLALEREKTIERLKQEHLWDLNAQLATPVVIQRLAVISNENAAGYQDFLNHIQDNSYGYQFDIHLFESALQGSAVENELPRQLQAVITHDVHFDVVVIIRGGGSKLDLSAFDLYNVAAAIARCPYPVWTGIGHEIDESISDLVAHRSLKTPTAVADGIVEYNVLFEAELDHMLRFIQNFAQQRISNEQLFLQDAKSQLRHLINSILSEAKYSVDSLSESIDSLINSRLTTERIELDHFKERIALLDPTNIMKKGFIIVEKDGNRVQSADELKSKDIVQLHLLDGKKEAEIK